MERNMALKPFVFITGPPGVGKTTLIVKVLERVRSNYPNIQVGGFYTRETRNSVGERVGFEAITVSGITAPLASTSPISTSSAGGAKVGRAAAPKVGKYNVDVTGFEELVLPELTMASAEGADCASRLFVIDEVGKMELFSPSFFPAVWKILNSESAASSVVLGTIPAPKFGREIAEVAQIKTRPDVAVYCLSKSNRDAMADSVYSHVYSLLISLGPHFGSIRVDYLMQFAALYVCTL